MFINTWREGAKRTDPGSFQWRHDRTRNNGHRLEHKMFHLNIRKHFFTVQMMQRWHRLSREAMVSPFQEIFKNHMDMVLGNLHWVSLLEKRCSDQMMTSSGPFQPQPLRDSVILWYTVCLRRRTQYETYLSGSVCKKQKQTNKTKPKHHNNNNTNHT